MSLFTMRCRAGCWRWLVPVLVVLGACSSDDPPEMASTAPDESTAPPIVSSAPPIVSSVGTEEFAVDAFVALGDEPVPAELATALQDALDGMAADGGMAATVISADGTWSGASGTADGTTAMEIDAQFAVGSVTKPIIAAQVMQLVEAGELALDDPVADHLPPDLAFDTNGATIRHLLGMRSGIPDYVPLVWDSLSTDRQHAWSPSELLALVPPSRAPVDNHFVYSSTNYLLLGLVIEQVSGRPVADVLRDGALSMDGLDRVVYQPAESPTAPMAMPNGESADALEQGGGYLPSIAGASAADAAGAIASDSASMAHWFRAFCSGDVVPEDVVTEMAALEDGYGLGLFNPTESYPQAIGHLGEHVGFVSWAGCVPEVGAVVVVFSNRNVDPSGFAITLLEVLEAA